MTPADLLGLWPVAAAIAAVVLRVVATRVDPRERGIIGAIETVALVLAIAAGVAFALLFGRRIGL